MNPMDLESPWFVRMIVLLASAGLGVLPSVALLLEAGNDWGRVAIAVSPIIVCTATGYLLFRLIRWRVPSGEE